MVQTGSIVLACTAILSGLFRAFVKPRIDETGYFRKVHNFNNEHCKPIEGLEACEDIYIHQPSGLAYLACSRVADRVHWIPALLKLNRAGIPFPSLDHVSILDLETQHHRKISLLNLPTHIKRTGLHTHGLDLYVEEPTESEFIPDEQVLLSSSPSSEKRATLYLINHNPPESIADAPVTGADSVIEVFETSVGSSEAIYRTTIRHPLIHTPNNLVATGPNSFYVTNDHRVKTSWYNKQRFEPFFFRDPQPIILDRDVNSIVHCTFTDNSETPNCIVAAEGHPHPNGIAKGPGSSIYLATTFEPHLYVYETQADHSLVLTDELKLPRMADNIFVSPSGSIYLATIPKVLSFVKAIEKPNEFHSPSEVWRISNSTGPDAFYGGRLAVEKILGDDGKVISGITAVGVHGTKIFLTGISSPHVSVCEMGDEKWTK
ncbi:hypothetical protein CROQUDRAFT_700722 [Cronartium quercuum f. sp. fusiforme G11]|uniref:Calcium-dependent phosphotriesterase n=1 Tax=Cronartium quercuum f. sp. fusiforme G11 TaxID=708437 RepID=A0A9P6TC04_9BASI|nr:hypothetical protein CROQUDRAFT_700722 [Cronartium quercuum f. sp. fusiforme G11]